MLDQKWWFEVQGHALSLLGSVLTTVSSLDTQLAQLFNIIHEMKGRYPAPWLLDA